MALTQAACDGAGSKCEPAEATVEPIGVELFLVEYVNAPVSETLYRNGEQIQLLERTSDQPTREVRATLSPAVLDAIEQAEAALIDGEQLGSFDLQCLAFIDRPSATLSLGVYSSLLRFRYPVDCPPSGLAQIDQVIGELMISLPPCSPTPLVTDCEIIGE